MLKRLDRLASDILDVTRIESKTLKLNKESFDIDQLVQKAIRETTERELSGNSKNLEISYSPFHCNVIADKAKILQVITNLFDNAVKYSRRKSEVKVSQRIQSSTGYAIIEVRSKPEYPIEPGEIDRIFDKGFRGRNARKVVASGTGLGLYICRQLVEDLHGGTLTVQSEGGDGLLFTVKLPRGEGG